MDQPAGDESITHWANKAIAREPGAEERFWSLVYDRLRILARGLVRHEAPERNLEATGVVGLLYDRMRRLSSTQWRDRKHFFGAAAAEIRRILVDLARHESAKKRGAGKKPSELKTSFLLADRSDQVVDVLDLHEALEQLGKLDEGQLAIVERKFFLGMTIQEIADDLDLAPRRVDGEWNMARTWLRRRLRRAASRDS